MHSGGVSIWFFIGILLTVYGLMIFGYRVSELISGQTANVQLAQYHTPVWWGAILLVAGLFYDYKFMPRRK